MSTISLFDPVLPEGFSYYPEFLSAEDEQRLLEIVQDLDLQPMVFQGYQAKRKTKSFGYDYHFHSRKLEKGLPIPETFNALIDKVSLKLAFDPKLFKEVLVTEYPPGSVINWHRDAPPFGLISGISLLSDCSLRFRPHDKSKQGRKTIINITIQRCSLYILDGISRSDWEHSILPVNKTRYSITLRTLGKF
ncbi:alpha-ketoglutarate-dependent dioxygenase AlkB [Pedobacter sp. Leaf176]|uniref:alpha-ketoglutarate-dependent dioxygenase AlkB n=1 Tax=Pedobacter sp. Leaf176 TaxID=1736286 RepID=UPI0006FE8B6A|nr:alpha-ketoglutarate-dependent dioxygenase AlkB [Pedobacter sp. Leaf176]KQR65315.1 hypothetical protein ASF92_20510 [Pedobacter sp. Leaf176]